MDGHTDNDNGPLMPPSDGTNVRWVRIENANADDLGGGVRMPAYVIVKNRSAVSIVEQMHVPNFWPSEIAELDRLRSDCAAAVNKALLTKLVMGTEARIVGPKIDDEVVEDFTCEHMESGDHVEFYEHHRSLRCGRCWLRIGASEGPTDVSVETAAAGFAAERKREKMDKVSSKKRGDKKCSPEVPRLFAMLLLAQCLFAGDIFAEDRAGRIAPNPFRPGEYRVFDDQEEIRYDIEPNPFREGEYRVYDHRSGKPVDRIESDGDIYRERGRGDR